MTRPDDPSAAKAADRIDSGRPGGFGDARPSRSIAVWAANLVLVALAVWPALVLIRTVGSTTFSVTLPLLIAGLNAFVLIALAFVAVQPRERKINLTLSGVACYGTFLIGDLVLSWQQKSLRSIAETYLVRP